MTVAGIASTPDGAIVWADSEVYRDGAQAGAYCKVSINPLAGIALTGCGWRGLLADAAAALQDAVSFDQLCDALPPVLRRSAAHGRHELRLAPATTEGAAIAAVGFAERFGRVVGIVWTAAADFTPMLAIDWCSPRVAGASYADTVDAAIAVASEQLGFVRREIPGATGGPLVVAELQRGVITAGRRFDLCRGTLSSWKTTAANVGASGDR